ncbi:hypothetical protein [Treponema sp. Marseille-Q4132]|uniref:hypothetical protein n=1 Tax=Treponema sp. Marseille-Q4132 TaxID=2766701 RepID=UPI001652C3BA|nr:hypothetical protein [Treponema sp. Marseille-Q4132]QNL97872.1 hypothetical protein H9I35_03725 [Treponema sp. Marseille-Q4132]
MSDKIFHFSDKKYLEKYFKAAFGYKIDWNHPKTFNEKPNWFELPLKYYEIK